MLVDANSVVDVASIIEPWIVSSAWGSAPFESLAGRQVKFSVFRAGLARRHHANSSKGSVRPASVEEPRPCQLDGNTCCPIVVDLTLAFRAPRRLVAHVTFVVRRCSSGTPSAAITLSPRAPGAPSPPVGVSPGSIVVATLDAAASARHIEAVAAVQAGDLRHIPGRQADRGIARGEAVRSVVPTKPKKRAS